ncbi:MAG: hypothetical protein Q4F41_09055 [Eubacteriales bacterium]|nr:hypothetical protein [Eubacteriales bacterium]
MPALRKNTNQILIETTVRKYLREISASPERGIRNLIDLALNFSNGRFQRNFLETAQAMLRNRKSAYYDLLKNVIAEIDHDTIVTFGMNIGYKSCTQGARRIRSIEEKKTFNIPWSLTFTVTPDSWHTKKDRYFSAVNQGKDLGIYTYLFRLTEEIPTFSALLSQNKDCAFILFVRPEQITPDWLTELAPLHNCMISVEGRSGFEAACDLLRKQKFLYAVHRKYLPEEKEAICDGAWIRAALPSHPAFLFVYPDRSVPLEMQKEVSQTVFDIRKQQTYPLFPMDLVYDNLLIDKIISDDSCLAAFDPEGMLSAFSNGVVRKGGSFFQTPLEELFSSALKKE